MRAQRLTVPLTLCLCVTPALGQTPAQPTESGSLEEVVITAQKREEHLEKVPVAAAVLSSDALANHNTETIADLNNLVPSVNINGTLNGRAPLGVRGISANANMALAGLSSGVAIMIDGVPIPSDSFRGNELEDLQRVEVLKGPQATLGGRTAAAGVINIVTHGPTDYFTGSVGATATGDGEYRLNGLISGPISKTLEFSLSAFGRQQDYPIKNLLLDKHTSQDAYGTRGKLSFSPTDDLEVLLEADFQRVYSQGFNLVYTYVTPGARLYLGLNYPPPFVFNSSMLDPSVLLPGIRPGWNNLYNTTPYRNLGQDAKDTDGSVTINYHLGDLLLSSTTAVQHEHAVAEQPAEVGTAGQPWAAFVAGNPQLGIPSIPYSGLQTDTTDVRQTSEELKLLSPGGRPFNYLVGLFYSDTKVEFSQLRDLPPAYDNYESVPDTKTYDIYGRATWQFLPTTSLVAGLRYNADRLSYTQTQIAYTNFPSNLASSGSSSSSAAVGDISLQQQLNDSWMVYASYARGYSPEVYNSALALSENSSRKPVGQEKINHFEVGSKGVYLDNRLSVNLAAFNTIYDHYQVNTYAVIPGVFIPPLILSSVAQAKTRGAELDSVFLPVQQLKLTLSAAYIDAKFTNYKNAPCWGGPGQETLAEGCHPDLSLQTAQPPDIQDISGKPMPNAPKFKGTFGAEEILPLKSSAFNVIFGGTYTYRSSAQMDPNQDPHAIQPAYGLLDLYVTLESKSGGSSITAFLNNVTDRHYATDVESFFTPVWNASTVVMQPARDAERYGGVRLNYRF